MGGAGGTAIAQPISLVGGRGNGVVFEYGVVCMGVGEGVVVVYVGG